MNHLETVPFGRLAADERGKICGAATPQAIGSGQNHGKALNRMGDRGHPIRAHVAVCHRGGTSLLTSLHAPKSLAGKPLAIAPHPGGGQLQYILEK
jgi:hypothetical protein